MDMYENVRNLLFLVVSVLSFVTKCFLEGTYFISNKIRNLEMV